MFVIVIVRVGEGVHPVFSVKLDFEIAVDKKIKAHNRTSKAPF